MKALGFLLDENLPPAIATQTHQREPRLDILAIGQPKAPARGTRDPHLLCWIEENDYILVTNNRTSMPGHLRNHLAAGRHVPGILVTPFPLDIGVLVEQLVLIWGASLADEYRDQIVYLPSR